MGFFLYFSTISMIILNYGCISVTGQPIYNHHTCYGANYTSNSTYQTNLINILLPSLSTSNNKTIIKNGYGKAIAGRGPDTVYGSFQCRGDITEEKCQEYVEIASKEITQDYRCPNSKKAIIWYDECMLRYSNQPYFSIMEEDPQIYISSIYKFSNNTDKFLKVLGGLMNDLVRESISNGSSSTKFAMGERNLTNSIDKVYGLVQCIPDISLSNCNLCLRKAIAVIPRCCDVREGGRVLRPSCNFRYETYPFFQSKVIDELEPSRPQSPLTNTIITKSKGKRSTKVFVIIVVVPTTTFLSTLIISFLYLRKRRKKAMKKFDSNNVQEIQSAESLRFKFSRIRAATNNFSDDNKLGQGGFGPVYKGKLSDGQDIAVKRLCRYSGQGEQEFKNEILLLVKLQHKNLVRLLGFCLHGEEKLLIYEFVSNASLDRFIFNPSEHTHLDWNQRYNIIGGIARGLVYLHEDSRLKIIHRDLKASNILLDTDMNPKISDFGMARIFTVDQTQASTSKVVGTYGYMAPEYAMQGHFSVKSDVFSFGVLVLEILSGQKNNSFHRPGFSEDLLSYTWRQWKKGTSLEVLDPVLRDCYSSSEVMKCIHIGLLCVQEDVSERPTMTLVVHMLNDYSLTLATPSLPPPFFEHTENASTSHQERVGYNHYEH